MSGFDPIRLEVIRNALLAAAEEMSVTIWRTSRSPIVREVLDYSTGVFDTKGRSVALAARIPVHLNSMAACLGEILDHHIPIRDWRRGDVIMTNDPYCGGQHLPDVMTFKPVFLGRRRIAIVGVLVHHLDVGGGAPGSYDPEATEIYHEGLRIPPVHVVARGRRNHDLVRLMLQNSREPELVGGDFDAQLAALEIGAAALEGTVRRYGADVLKAAGAAIQAQSERGMRAAIAAVPDGVYEFEDFVDDDGIRQEPIRIHVELTVSGDEIEVDLSGSADQVAGPVNCTQNMTGSAVICAVLMSIGQEIPANDGCSRPIRLVAPPGTVVNARAPAPVANRMAVAHRVVNTVMGAFAQALPGAIPAAYYGVSYAYALNAPNPDGSARVYFDLECGGWGAHPDHDGANGHSCGLHNVANSPIEMIEAGAPVTFLAYGLNPDSGGAGRRRGGLGLHREFRLEAPAASFAANLDRFRFPAYGLAGGRSGSTGALYLKRAGQGQVESLDSKVSGLALAQGDIIRVETSGGGGYGDPKDRDPAAIRADLDHGYITPEAARRLYGYPRE